MSGHTRILVADLPSDWRSEVVDGLRQSEPALRVTESGQELRRALEEVVEPPRIIVVGPVLKGIGGLEALFQAERSLLAERKTRPEWPVRLVSLITEVRSDAELLDLYRRRGVGQFLYRDDPVERTIATLRASLHPASRAMVRLEATAVLSGGKARCSVYDLSTSGARVVIAQDAVRGVPAVGDMLRIQLEFRSEMLDYEAEVRGMSSREGFLGGRLVLGVQFQHLEAAATATLETIIRHAAEESQMAREE